MVQLNLPGQNLPGLSQFQRLSERTVFVGAFLTVLLLWTLVCVLSRNPGALALVQYLVIAAIMMVCTLGVIWRYQTGQCTLAFRWILLSAIVLRLVSLIGEPLFEDDYWRYLWDGFQMATTSDPYTLAPEAFFDVDVPAAFEPILSSINYPNVATVYGPVSQWLFAIGYLVAPAEVWPLQLMTGIADVLVLVILFKLGAGKALLLYAWSPLLLKEFSLTAHPDIYGVLGLMLAVYAAFKHRPVLSGVVLALAIGSKVFAILALPYLLTRGWGYRSWLGFIVGFSACLIAITLQFGTVTIWVPEGLLAMADSWLFNAPVYLLLLPWLDFTSIKWLLLSLFVVYGLVTGVRRLQYTASERHASPVVGSWAASVAAFRGDWLFGLFLLCLPVLNPWYIAWVLPFAVLYPRWWSWTASYAVLLSYWYGDYSGQATTYPDTLVVLLEVLLVVLLPLVSVGIRRHLNMRACVLRQGEI